MSIDSSMMIVIRSVAQETAVATVKEALAEWQKMQELQCANTRMKCEAVKTVTRWQQTSKAYIAGMCIGVLVAGAIGGAFGGALGNIGGRVLSAWLTH